MKCDSFRQLKQIAHLLVGRLSIGRALAAVLFVSLFSSAAGPIYAQQLEASDGAAGDLFGNNSSIAGDLGVVGAYSNDAIDSDSGSAYVFRNLNTVTGTITESVRLSPTDGAENDWFGYSTAVSNNTALVGSFRSLSAYLFRGVDTASGTLNESAILAPTDPVAAIGFGTTISIDGNTALVGASRDLVGGIRPGSVYVYHDLDTASGTINESLKLIASDGSNSEFFGSSVSLSGGTALVGRYGDSETAFQAGSAYVFRNVDVATGTKTEQVKLLASDGQSNDRFGSSVSLSGSRGIVGTAHFSSDVEGSAYFFKDLTFTSGTITETAKLIASDGQPGDDFGMSVGISGQTAIVGAKRDEFSQDNVGSAYLYTNLDSASGETIEAFKVFASDGADGDSFGSSVSIDGDRFLIGASGKNAGRGMAYTGTVSSMSTLDFGNTSAVIDGLSFRSKTDWIIGNTTVDNHVLLADGNSATFASSLDTVYIGGSAGANENSLTIAGSLSVYDIQVGNIDNYGNQLVFEDTASLNIGSITLFLGNSLLLEGEFTSFDLLDAELGDTQLFHAIGSNSELITADNFSELLLTHYDGDTGFTTFTAVPEPTSGLVLLLGMAGLAFRRKRLMS